MRPTPTTTPTVFPGDGDAAAAQSGGYPLAEELANSITHGLGAALGLAALAVLVTLAARRGTASHVVGCAVFGSTLVLLYTASTLYHAIPHAAAKRVLQVLDHSAIYLLIAGTYTPFMLVTLRGAWGWTLLAVVWAAAAAGIALCSTVGRRAHAVSVALYIVMGWIGVVAFRPIVATIGWGGMGLIAGGGLVYTIGVLFYAWRRLPYHHAIWHLFVLAGSGLHVAAVLRYVIPRG
jgi:hemolysin III